MTVPDFRVPIGFLIVRPQRLADVGEALLQRGQPEAALDFLDEGFSQMQTEGWQERNHEAHMPRVRGRISRALGRPEEALQAWAQGKQGAAGEGRIRAGLLIAADEARLLEDLGQSGEAETVLETVLAKPGANANRRGWGEAKAAMAPVSNAREALKR